MSYTQVFGGNTIYPNEVSYLPLALSANTALEWPLDNSGTITPAARIIGVTAAGAYTITLPPADETGPGQTILFDNLPASASLFYVVDATGGAVATVAVGTQWQVYLADNTTAAGVWRVYQMGASTATVQPANLAGAGLTVIANQLAQSQMVTEFTTTPRTLLVSDRANVMIWTGSGAGTLNLMAAVTAGNNFFISVRNSGGGDFTVDPSGSETIDDAPTLVLRPGDSATLVTNGLEWYTVGLGQQAVFAFDYTVVDITGEADPYVLSGSELNRIAYRFTGALTHDLDIVVPNTIQQYWVDNDTTGSFEFTVRTSGGTPYVVGQGDRVILYCDGSEVVNANTANGGLSPPVSAADGGTGQTSYVPGDILYASGATALSRLADVATGNALLSGGIGLAPTWGKVDLTTHVTGQLPLASGGTGANLTAPGADRIFFYDFSATSTAFATLGSNLAFTGTTLDALPGWTSATNTSSPNATVPVVSLVATNAATNVDAAFTPKGSGAIVAVVADGTATGGNKRGIYAVDWQRTRDTATQVASGAYSVVSGGLSNTASGVRSAVLGGSSNRAGGDNSVVVGGANAFTRNTKYAEAFGNGTGEVQRASYVLSRITTNATVTTLTTDGSTPSTGGQNILVLDLGTAYYFKAAVIGRRTDSGSEVGAYSFEGCVKNDGGTIAFVGTPTKVVVGENTAAWDANVIVSATGSGGIPYPRLDFTVTGEASKTISWGCRVDTVELQSGL